MSAEVERRKKGPRRTNNIGSEAQKALQACLGQGAQGTGPLKSCDSN